MRLAWTPSEDALLERHVEDREREWLPIVTVQLPHRTVTALKTRMSKLRGDLGLREPDMTHYRADGARGSAKLLDALLRLAA